MGLFIVARLKARDMRLHHAGAHHHKRVSATAAAALPFVEGKLLDVRNEIGFPHTSFVELSLGGEIIRVASVAVGEVIRIIKNEVFAGPLAQKLRQVGHGKPARRTRQAGVKKLMLCVGRQDEITTGPPLESLLWPLAAPNRGRAMSEHDVERFGVQMSERRRGTTRR